MPSPGSVIVIWTMFLPDLHRWMHGSGLIAGGHGEDPPLRHGLDGVPENIHQGLLDAAEIAVHRRHVRRVARNDADIVHLGPVPEYIKCFSDNVVKIMFFYANLGRARKIQKISRYFGATAGLGVDIAHVVLKLGYSLDGKGLLLDYFFEHC